MSMCTIVVLVSFLPLESNLQQPAGTNISFTYLQIDCKDVFKTSSLNSTLDSSALNPKVMLPSTNISGNEVEESAHLDEVERSTVKQIGLLQSFEVDKYFTVT